MRLRESLVKAVEECAVLGKVYRRQCKFAGAEVQKLIFTDSINFETQGITKGKINFLDLGKGTILNLALPVKEFDSTLLSNLNFTHGQAFQLLITDLGVEELRSVLHYQMMQHQLLSIAVEKNQLLLDGCEKGINELDFISSKDGLEFILPNSNLKLSHVLSKNVEGYNLDLLNKERVRLKNNFKKDATEHFSSVMNLKAKYRPAYAKKYQIFLNKLSTSDHKIEGKLRILRSYRIKLLHQYCRDSLREAYQESIKAQLLRVCTDLRLRVNLLPFQKKSELLFFCGQSEFHENLPTKLQENNCLFQDPVYNIDIYNQGGFKTLFYVPHSIEICFLDNKIPPEHKTEYMFPSGIAEQINEDDLEKSIKTVMVPKPTPVKKFRGFKRLTEVVRDGIVTANFKEAYSYGGPTYDLLVYLTLVYNIFQLEYSICKLNSSGNDILKLETQVLSGQQFWKNELEPKESENKDEDAEEVEEYKDDNPQSQSISTQLIRKIVLERREKQHLAEDLRSIKEDMKSLKKFIKNTEDRNLERVTNILIHHHHLLYYLVLHGMEKVQDAYCKKENLNEFRVLTDYINHFTGRNEGIVIRDNGFHVNQALIKPNG